METALCQALLRWYDQSKRDLPWRRTHDPYCIWLSEIMLQQTRTETVKAYYQRFLALFPTVEALADAEEAQVLKAWEGLGYYSRARNMRRAAQTVAGSLNGAFPTTYEGLLRLPGVGPYTAGAVASIAFGERVPAIDGNVYRVIARRFGVRESINHPQTQQRIRELVLSQIPESRPGDFNQGLMELGATLCLPARPRCDLCPLREGCDACAEGDEALLPIHEKKKLQRVIPMAVCLLTYQGKVLVVKRTQRMLGGLYVFMLLEEESKPARAAALLKEQGFLCGSPEPLGTARHVFTHQIWEMSILRFQLKKPPTSAALAELKAHMADKAELDALAMPAAMKAARSAALNALQ